MGEVTRTRRYLSTTLIASLVTILIARLSFVECSDYIQLPNYFRLTVFILGIVAIWVAIASTITLVVLLVLKKLRSFKHLK